MYFPTFQYIPYIFLCIHPHSYAFPHIHMPFQHIPMHPHTFLCLYPHSYAFPASLCLSHTFLCLSPYSDASPTNYYAFSHIPMFPPYIPLPFSTFLCLSPHPYAVIYLNGSLNHNKIIQKQQVTITFTPIPIKTSSSVPQ